MYKTIIICIFAAFTLNLTGCTVEQMSGTAQAVGVFKEANVISEETAEKTVKFIDTVLDLGTLATTGGSLGTVGILAYILKRRKG